MRLVLGRDLPKRAVRRLVRESRKPVRRMIPSCRALDVGAANSLCDQPRLAGLQRLADRVARSGVGGDMVECGVYRGGSAVVIAERLLRGLPARQVWLMDVFDGMPEPGPHDPPQAWADVGKFMSSEAIVRQTFAAARVAPGNLHVVVGTFENTLVLVPSIPVAFLHLDCDWYESVRLCLHRFYDAVVPGGAVVFDDYGFWSGCRKAVDEFMAERRISVQLVPIDSTSHYFLKPRAR